MLSNRLRSDTCSRIDVCLNYYMFYERCVFRKNRKHIIIDVICGKIRYLYQVNRRRRILCNLNSEETLIRIANWYLKIIWIYITCFSKPNKTNYNFWNWSFTFSKYNSVNWWCGNRRSFIIKSQNFTIGFIVGRYCWNSTTVDRYSCYDYYWKELL